MNTESDADIRWDSLRRFIRHYAEHRRDLVFAIVVAFLGAVSTFLIPTIFRRIQNAVVDRDGQVLLVALALFLAVVLIEVAATTYSQVVTARISTQMNERLTLTYYERLLNADVEEFIAFKRRTNLFQRIMDAMSITRISTQVLVLGTQKLIVVLVVGAVIGFVSPVVLVVLLVGAIALFLYAYAEAQRLRRLRQRSLAVNYPLVGKMTEVIAGLFTVKALAARMEATSDIAALISRKSDADFAEMKGEIRSNQIGSSVRSLTLVVATGASFVLMIRGSLLVADVFSLYVLTQLLLQPVTELAFFLQQISRLSVNIESFYEVVDMKGEDAGSVNGNERARPACEVTPGGGHIVIRDLSFAYRGGKPVLEDIDLEIQPGEKVSLIGRSGVGKTTLLRLLLGFLHPQRGEIVVDGRNIEDFEDMNAYRNRFGVVGQQDFLFGTTIRENLGFGLNGQLREEHMETAIRMVGLWDDLQALEDGLDTVYSSDLLSGGQVQRLFIARAALRRPEIVLLDEPTSALDFESEKLVMDAIDHLVGQRTCLTIAHRLSTVQRADRVVVLADGRIRAAGPHAELYETDSYYRALCDYNSFIV